MNSTPKVSVIIPVYNTEDYIAETMLSIMNQSLKEIEIIVINDGSTDNSLEVIKNTGREDTRVKIISRPNKGLSLTRNEGVDAATGKYVYFMDSDDILEVVTLEECYQACETETLDFVFFDAVAFKGKEVHEIMNHYDRTQKIKKEFVNGKEWMDHLMDEHAFHSSACLFVINRAFLKKHNIEFYPKIIHEDNLFTPLLYVKAEKVKYLQKPFFKRRVREDSIMTSAFKRKNMDGYITVAIEVLNEAAKENKENGDLLRKYVQTFYNPALDKATALPFGERLYVFKKSIKEFKAYVKPKMMVKLLLGINNN